MSREIEMHIEPTDLVEVGGFLRRKWAIFDREFLDDDTVWWQRKRHVLRAVVDGQPVAVADFYILAGVAHLSEIIVGQAWRNQGIGAQLMARFEQMARAAGCHKLSLRTAKTSASVRFYSRLGYEVEATIVNHYHGLDFVQFL